MSALGPRGVTVLSIAGIAGLCLAIIGWTQRGTGVVNPQVTATPATSVAGSGAPSSPPATRSATATPSATASSSAAAGPQLSSQPYASYAYQVWPGPLNAGDKLALTGFSLTVTRQPGGITVKAIQDGAPMTSVSHFYPTTASS